jgi:rhodanese-related sulfurtransferase
MDITVQELKQKLDRGDKFLFLDVREQYEFDEFNLGAQLIPLGELMNRAWELEDAKGSEVVIHCRSGKRSAMGQQILQMNGFTNVRNLEGGVMAWIDAFGAKV